MINSQPGAYSAKFFGCSAKRMCLALKDQKKKEIVMEHLSLRQIEKVRETMIEWS